MNKELAKKELGDNVNAIDLEPFDTNRFYDEVDNMISDISNSKLHGCCEETLRELQTRLTISQ